MEDNASGPVFRANKRRKVFRKRADSDASGDEPHVASTVQGPDSITIAGGINNTVENNGDASPLSETSRVRRLKKHGIAFSSSDQTSSRPHDNQETALVVSEAQTQDPQNGRFARQTGRAVVVDDKHMSAYIDSKLAEMRSAATVQKATTQPSSQAPDNTQQANTSQQPPNPTEHTETAPLSPPPQPNNPQPIQALQAPTTSNNKRRQPRRPRQPSPSTQARASLIDQIMRESNHTPHYTPPTNATAPTKKPVNTTEEELDPDAAAAAAFKADFLAQAEARNLSRRKPKVPAAGNSSSAAANATVSSGPKLGGSRAARVRMRAAEEAKGKK